MSTSLIASFFSLVALDWWWETGLFSFFIFIFGLALIAGHSLIHVLSTVAKDDLSLPTFSSPLLSSSLETMTHSSAVQSIFSNPDSRNIAVFLLVNLAFMFVELVYGYLTNSLGLISDAFHMLFDCVALAIGLYASIVKHWPPSRKFTYGYEHSFLCPLSSRRRIFLIFLIFSSLRYSLVHSSDMGEFKYLVVL